MDERKVGSLRLTLDFSQPLYEQILAQMRSLIARGAIDVGEKIPSVREMAHELKINPNTVMHAYQELERDGLTEKRRGQGTFVTESVTQIRHFKERLAFDYSDQFLDKMHSLGFRWTEIQSFLTTTREKKGER
ncbi:GntR family transcriptional regulator [Sporolactobacillus putidus]|uniref:GntR family transcriptional regulator n=1 Tax=Sporolactobacillus putidus TaxID=492735 RepID=A0A917S0W7_9BACL|nr:GntR family transcriptional regulator [Sporolactobacillus putidus]GGL49712.1 GntR family transcriptional regulator [Sporolactobacillus putidus]